MLWTTNALRTSPSSAGPHSRVSPTLTIGLIGLGYVGLMQAVAFAQAGVRVIGYDRAARVRNQIRDGVSPVDTVSHDELHNASKRLTIVDHVDGLREASAMIICVPTPLDSLGHPDLAIFRSCVSSVASILRAGHLICIESTVHPGATREIALPILRKTGLLPGRDFSLAYAPERLSPGSQVLDIPRVIGGLTSTCAQRAAQLYSALKIAVNLASSIEVAEAAKMLENAYRLVNISFINEFAEYCALRGIDVRAAISAAESKPFGFASFHPSAGAGGHCIPVDPVYLIHDAARAGLQMITLRAAVVANEAAPLNVAMACRRLLARAGIEPGRARILLLGLSYKPDVSDIRNTACEPLLRALRQYFADVVVHDPRVSAILVDNHIYSSVQNLDAALRDADLVVMAQRHSEYSPTQLAAARRIYYCDHGGGPVPAESRPLSRPRSEGQAVDRERG